MQPSNRFKLVILGDPGVGKTSLIVRYIKNKFESEYISTIGVDFLIKDVELQEQKGGNTRLVIWDIGGQDEWKQKMHLYLKGADGAVVVCDLTRPSTGKSISSWITDLKKYSGDVPYLIVGNKNDLKQKITDNDLKNISKGHVCYKSSAKTGEIVEDFFNKIANLIFESKRKK